MEYQVTATRRRPQRFEDLLGQEFVAATLQKSIEAGKIAHAYLFSGPRGCGKTSSARILAKALNCAEGTVATPCGICTSCREITAGSSIDVIEIDGASNTSVNDVRQIKDEILFPPNASRYKIYIIDEVHMLSASAFNALLKTIEEPPPYVIFIFATTELHKVPATIKSRCQHFNFKLVGVEQLKYALAETAAEMHIQADDEALYWIAREATGSVRDCYTLFDQVTAFSDGHITFEKIQSTLGLTGTDSIGVLLSACVRKEAAEALLALDGILQNGVSAEQFTVDCTNYIRSLLLIKHGITKEALIGQRAERFPQEILQGWSAQQLERGLYLFLQLFKDLRFSLNQRYELELTVSRLAWLSDYVCPHELKMTVDSVRQLITGALNQCSRPIGGQPSVLPEPQGAGPFVNTGSFSAQKAAGSVKITQEQKTEPLLPQQYGQPPADETVPVQPEIRIESPAALKELLIQQLQVEHSMLAIALTKTPDWQQDTDALRIPVQTPFEVQFLQKERLMLQRKIEALYKKEITLQIILQEEKAVQNTSIPNRVEMVRRQLKGSIVDIRKKTVPEQEEELEEE